MMKEGSMRDVLYKLEVGQSAEFSEKQYKENTVRHTASIFRATHNRRYKVEPIEEGWRVTRAK